MKVDAAAWLRDVPGASGFLNGIAGEAGVACFRDLLRSLGQVAGGGDGGKPVFSEEPWEWGVRRPSLPPLLFVALTLWGADALVIDLLFGRAGEWGVPTMVLGLACAGAGVAALLRSHAFVGSIVLGFGMGCLLAASHCLVMSAQQQALSVEGPQVLEIVRDSRTGEYGSSALAHLEDGVLVRLLMSDDAPLKAGERVEAHVSLSAPSEKRARESWHEGIVADAKVGKGQVLPEAPPLSWIRSLRTAGIDRVEQARAWLAWLAALAGLAGSGADSQAFAEPALFLRAVLLGYSDGLYETGFYQSVRVDGLAHLVAVSGAHLVIVCGFAMTLLRRLSAPRALAVFLQVTLIGCYLVLTGAPVSARRAAVMTCIALLSFFGGRRPYALGGLSACIIVMISIDPATAYSTSFMLSAASTLGIVLFAGFMESWIELPSGIGRSAVVEAVALTFAASLSTTPASSCLFGQVSLVAPLANALAAPVFAFACGAGFALVFLAIAVAPVGVPLLGGLIALMRLFCLALDALSGLPLASVPAYLSPPMALGIAVGLPALLWLVWPRPSRRGLACLAAAVAAAVFATALAGSLAGDRIVMLDVGQGDAFLISSKGANLLIDTGTQDVALLQGLGAQGVRHLDAVLITHPDDDHCGSLAALRGVVSIDRLLVAADLLDCDDANCAKLRASASTVVGAGGIVGLHAGDTFTCGNCRFTVVGPEHFTDGGGNADSLTVVMKADDDRDGNVDHTALFCGDAESEQLHAYNRAGLLQQVEIYKVGHHGSRAALDAELAQLLSPKVSLVSVGAYNRYGHPTAETLETLEAVGSRIFRTDEQGAVTCLMRPGRLEVRTES